MSASMLETHRQMTYRFPVRTCLQAGATDLLLMDLECVAILHFELDNR